MRACWVPRRPAAWLSSRTARSPATTCLTAHMGGQQGVAQNNIELDGHHAWWCASSTYSIMGSCSAAGISAQALAACRTQSRYAKQSVRTTLTAGSNTGLLHHCWRPCTCARIVTAGHASAQGPPSGCTCGSGRSLATSSMACPLLCLPGLPCCPAPLRRQSHQASAGRRTRQRCSGT